MSVDMTDAILGIASPVLLYLLSVALGALKKWIGLQLEDSDRLALEKLLKRGLALSVEKLGGSDGKVQVHLKNQLAADVMSYAVKTSPDLVKRLVPTSDKPLAARIAAEIVTAKVVEGGAK